MVQHDILGCLATYLGECRIFNIGRINVNFRVHEKMTSYLFGYVNSLVDDYQKAC